MTRKYLWELMKQLCIWFPVGIRTKTLITHRSDFCVFNRQMKKDKSNKATFSLFHFEISKFTQSSSWFYLEKVCINDMAG